MTASSMKLTLFAISMLLFVATSTLASGCTKEVIKKASSVRIAKGKFTNATNFEKFRKKLGKVFSPCAGDKGDPFSSLGECGKAGKKLHDVMHNIHHSKGGVNYEGESKKASAALKEMGSKCGGGKNSLIYF